MLVHAHPDDELLSTGLSIADTLERGGEVLVVTCTKGQQGEVIGPHLGLETPAALGEYRARELAAALAELGPVRHEFLADGRWSDSGMRWVAPGQAGPAEPLPEGAFAAAELEVAAAELAGLITSFRPQVLVTYDPLGGYQHPDHIQAHRVTMRAAQLLADPPAVHWIQVAQSWAQAERSQAQATELPAPFIPDSRDDAYPAVVVPDAELDVVLQPTPDVQAAVARGLRRYQTQVQVADPWLALSDNRARLLPTKEGFKRVLGPSIPAGQRPASSHFVGLD